jgi:hypothetical protein
MVTSGRVVDESGLALVVVLMTMTLMLVLGLALTLTTMTETRVAANHQRGVEAQYAAEAAVERAAHELRVAPDWNAFLGGLSRSAVVDGSSPDADVVTTPDAHLHGAANDPVWQLFAYGPLTSFLPSGMSPPPIYVVVWVGDDAAENDGDPRRDGGPPAGCDVVADPSCADANPGRGVIEVLAQATGLDGTRRTIQATLARGEESSGGRIVSWRQDD